MVLAISPIGTTLSLDPLPSVRRYPTSRLTALIFSDTNSETRNPVAYINSSIAKSLTPVSVLISGAAISASTSCIDITFGSFRQGRGEAIVSIGFSEIKLSIYKKL